MNKLLESGVSCYLENDNVRKYYTNTLWNIVISALINTRKACAKYIYKTFLCWNWKDQWFYFKISEYSSYQDNSY